MKKFIVLILAMAFLLTGSTVFAANKLNTYFKGAVGATIATDAEYGDFKFKTNPGFILSGALGFHSQQTKGLRGEIEVFYQTYDFDKINASMSSFAFMGNGYFDLSNNSEVTPYLMLGIGLSNNSVGDSSKDTWTGFSYQAGLGISYPIDKLTTLDLGYKYFKTSKYTEDGVDFVPGGTNNFMIGFRRSF